MASIPASATLARIALGTLLALAGLLAPVSVVPAAAATPGEAAAETCALFRQLMAEVRSGSGPDRDLLDQMSASVRGINNSDFTRAVLDMRQGQRNSDPQRFVAGMRTMNQLCRGPLPKTSAPKATPSTTVPPT